MSPAALGGPPHTRISPLNGGGPVSTERGKKTNGLGSMAGVNRVFPPLEELVSVKPEINIHSPLRKILEEGERFAKSADTNLDFRRPDLALQEYIKASIVAVEIVPRHKDYPSVQSDRGELHRLYQGLTKRIRTQHEKFGEVKEIIKENNARNGVRSTSDKLLAENLPRSSNGVANGHARASSTGSSLSNGSSLNSVQNNGQKIAPSTPPKKKPPIQPKPNGLHGKAIQPTGASTPTDLAARFARLRTPESNAAVQDPRIRTQPISIPGELEPTSVSLVSSQSSNYTTSKPSGPREMPSVPTTAPRPKLIPLDVPAMPRAPDPIYNSPARNEDTTTTANLPSSAPRTSSYLGSGRKNSAPPISMVKPTPNPIEDTFDYFTPAHSVNGFSGPRKARPEVNIPDSTTIKAEQLYEYLKMGSHALRVLLVDLRSRELFDSGHIMSQTIICVEPITLKHGVSGEELEDTLIIAPDSEQALYNKRHEFDLVVFYDQSSSSLRASSAAGDISDGTLQRFATAVYEYGYEKRLKRQPMLLIGGLDAWVDLLGPNSLQVSSAGIKPTVNGPRTSQKVARPLGRVTMNRTPRATPPVPRRLESRPLTRDEETTWSEAVNDDQAMVGSPISEDHSSDEVYYARTTDDFMRRYPEVSTMQESMMSVSAAQNSFNADFVSTIPRPPARPPPALPRQRSSGISDRGLVAHTPAHNADLQTKPTKVTPGRTGLSNPGVLCYMNSTFQALSATAFFRNFLLNTEFPELRVPRKGTETTDPPQLMVRNIRNLFYFLWSGEYTWLTPRTLHRYINAVHISGCPVGSDRNMVFGGHGRQHDAQEFFLWLVDILEDETNSRRHKYVAKTDAQQKQEFAALETQLDALPTFKAAQMAWTTTVLRSFASPISANMRGCTARVRFCSQPGCGHETRGFDPFFNLNIGIPLLENGNEVAQGQLADWIYAMYGSRSGEEVFSDCDKCGKKLAKKNQNAYFTYLPNYLVLSINRFNNKLTKVLSQAILPGDYSIDLGSCFLPEAMRRQKDPEKPGEVGPFIYDIYAVVHHRGATMAAGHYWTCSRNLDKPGTMNQWHEFNDESVRATNRATIQGSDGTAYMYFLRRRGAPDEMQYDQLQKYGIPETT